MSLPRAWIGKHMPRGEKIMKIQLDNNSATTLCLVVIFAFLFGVTQQITSCAVNKDKGEKSCLTSGGDPYKCCEEFSSSNCNHLLEE